MKQLINNFIEQINVYTFLIFIAAFLFLAMLIYPKGRDIYNNKLFLEQKKLRLMNANIAIGELNSISRDYIQLKQLVDEKKNLLVDPLNIGDILLMVDKAVRQSNVRLISVTSKNERISEPVSFGAGFVFQLLPVDVIVRGAYAEISIFIEELLDHEKLVILRHSRIENTNSDNNDLSCQICIDVFIKCDLKPVPSENKDDVNV